MLHSCRCHKYSLTTMFVAYLAYWEYHLHLGLWKKWLLIHSPFFLVFPINLLQVVFCLPCEWIDKNCKSVIYYLIVIEYKVSFQHSIGESKTVINKSLLLYIILLNYLQDKLASVLRCFRQFVSVMLLKDDEYGEMREKFWLKKGLSRDHPGKLVLPKKAVKWDCPNSYHLWCFLQWNRRCIDLTLLPDCQVSQFLSP